MVFTNLVKQVFVILLFQLLFSGNSLAQSIYSWSWNLSCNANWDETCEGTQILSLESGFRLCGYQIIERNMTRSRAYYRVTETDRISVKVYLYSTGSGLFFDQTRGWVELTVIVFGIDSSLSDDQVRSACSSISNGYVSSIKTDIQRGTETKCAVAALFCKDYVIENGTRKYVSDWYPCGICFSLSFFPYKQDLLFGLLRFRLSMYQVKLRIISPHLRASINN